MSEIRLIEIKEEILTDNKKAADDLRKKLKDRGIFLLNLMSSPGAGKTSLILRTVGQLKTKFRIGVLEADIDSTVDAEKIVAAGIPAVQIRTGGFCHLDAGMVMKGLDALDLSVLDLVIIENVGNLVCPAEFDTGAVKNAMILSVPEGDDKPLKYPLMFNICNCCKCCCGVLRSINEFGIPAPLVINSHYYAEINSDECTGCGICADERCQVNAITEEEDVYRIVQERCIGCGLCIGTCPMEAIRLIHKDQAGIAPPPLTEDAWFVARGAARGIDFSKFR